MASLSHGSKFKVIVRPIINHLQYFKTQPILSGRQSDGSDVMADFDFDIEYIEGKTNIVADGLSRRHDHQHISQLSDSSPIRSISVLRHLSLH